jgi:hypothetical protein
MATFEGMDKTTSLLPASSIVALGLFAFFLPDILPPSSFFFFLTASEQWLLIVSTLSFLVLLFVLNHKSRLLRGGWVGLDVTGSMSLTLFLISFSFLNFSFVLLASLIFVPLCSYLTPTLLGPLTKSNEVKVKGQDMELGEGKLEVTEKVLTLFKLLLTVLVSPLVLFSLASYFTGVRTSELVGLVMNQYQHYSTLAFPFLCLVYLPWSLTTFASLWYSLK